MRTLLTVAVACLAIVHFVYGEQQYAPIVQLTGGKVRGLIVQDDTNHNLFLYQGIRYGRAERFAKPQAVEAWTEVYNATSERDACPQPLGDAATSMIQGRSHSEDCLFVNVWRPVTERANRPVMVWIHGGGFTIGTIFSIANDARYFVNRGDVVVVAVNYRLGPFGFLYGNASDTPGNLGLHDQILALRWVQQNIHSFGGDPHQVTVFGESAGSISIGALILSPLAKGLFQRAIMQSGGPMKVETREVALARTKSLALKLNCPGESLSGLIRCLRSKTVDQLLNYTKLDFNSNDYYKPVYGDDLLPLSPVEALKSGKHNRDIDLLYGVTQNEGSYFTLNIFSAYKESNSSLTVESAGKDIVHVMKIHEVAFPEEIAHFYLSNVTNSSSQDELKEAVASAIGDQHITCPTILFAEQVAKFSPNNHYYSYQFGQRFPISVNGNLPWLGVTHAEDVLFMFLVPFLGSEDNKQLTNSMIEAWTNFAKTGHPGKVGAVQWSGALNGGSTSYMHLQANHYRMVSGHYHNTCETLWRSKML